MSNLNYETVYEYVTISGHRLDMTYKIRRKVNGTNYSTTTSILLGECKRKVLDTETDKQLNIRISSNLKDKIDKFAKDSGQSSTAWIIDLIERETTNNGNVQKNYTGKRIEDLISNVALIQKNTDLILGRVEKLEKKRGN